MKGLITNSFFKKLIDTLNIDIYSEFEVPELFNNDVIKINLNRLDVGNNGGYLIINKKTEGQFIDATDLTGSEWNINKVWIGFSKENFGGVYVISRKYFDLLSLQLKQDFPNDSFILNLSIDYGENKNIVIRFHKLRDNDIGILTDNLELYKDNGMLVEYIN